MIAAFRQQLERFYKSYLTTTILGEPFSPIILRGEKAKPATMADLQKIVSLFLQNEKSETKRGWSIEWTDWNSKIVGRQKWVSKIIVETEDDFLYLIQKEQEVIAFKNQLSFLLKWRPEVRLFLAERPARVLNFKEAWKDIQQVVDYLLVHDVTGYYVRSIPVPVHTKFMEKHQSLILSLLKFIAPGKLVADSINLERALDLKSKPLLYTVRWLDKDMSQQLMHGMEFTGVTAEWLRQVRWTINEVWLVENETNLYLVPPRKNAIALFSKGYAISQLRDIHFFNTAKIYYWGDLDEDGYKMLNGMRACYPHVSSVFMDEHTLISHAVELVKQEAVYKTGLLPFLTKEEQAAFNILKHHNGRLEQERIRQDYITDRLLYL
ncbi:DUF2220 family protein [Niabella yanshanensis]|uniref:DUF2220 family protein n=1 Tax=Niabella yanshanensis TaxID=577386 RepID=A0ABZ0WAN8_9BACT|nr:Wadjet anti-phage system protein JetD domain-containing protein [Niabella yanshanensis]WQD39146.1 DUF2220 family protein [Niabella yanshanensis]